MSDSTLLLLLVLVLVVALWFALSAISYLLLRFFGWQRLRQFPFAIVVLVGAWVSLPLATAGGIGWKYRSQVVMLTRSFFYEAPAIDDSCPVFPADNIWNVPVASLPVHSRSAAYVSSIGANVSFHPDFGTRYGIPYTVLPDGAAPVDAQFRYADESDPGPYLIPRGTPVEVGGDRHALAVDLQNCRLYELFSASWRDGKWQAGSGAIFDLKSNELRKAGLTSADAAGLPILAGLVRYPEVAEGEIRHALRFTVRRSQNSYVWPARHRASSSRDENLPPMGQRFRLRADFDISGYAPQAQVILKALKEYGMMLADNGSNWYLTGATDSRWDNAALDQLKQLKGSDFEAVDVSSLMIDENSGATAINKQ